MVCATDFNRWIVLGWLYVYAFEQFLRAFHAQLRELMLERLARLDLSSRGCISRPLLVQPASLPSSKFFKTILFTHVIHVRVNSLELHKDMFCLSRARILDYLLTGHM